MKHLNDRREGALSRLTEQLKSGVKKAKKSNEIIELTDADKKRINREIDTLKARLHKTG